MTHFAARTLLPALLLGLTACSNSGLNQLTAGSGDTGATSHVETCPWVGSWNLQTVECGNTGSYDSWTDRYPNAAMVVEQAAAGGCDVTFTWSSDSCEEVEAWHTGVPDEDGLLTVDYNGIATCNPDSCTFAVDDEACAVGDHKSTDSAITVEEDDGTQLKLDGLLNAREPVCPLGLVTTWARS